MAKKATKKTAKKANKKKKSTRQDTAWPNYDVRFDLDELRSKLKIDKHALDVEVEQQPELFGEVGDAAALAKSQVDSLAEQLKELESDIDAEARRDAEVSGDRITENAIKSIVAGSKERKDLVIRLLQAQDRQRRLDALTTAFRHKSYAMRDMVDLYLASYYSSRSASGAQEDQRDDDVSRIRTRMGERRKNRVGRHRSRGGSS